jgi:hypothetical protein
MLVAEVVILTCGVQSPTVLVGVDGDVETLAPLMDEAR